MQPKSDIDENTKIFQNGEMEISGINGHNKSEKWRLAVSGLYKFEKIVLEINAGAIMLRKGGKMWYTN